MKQILFIIACVAIAGSSLTAAATEPAEKASASQMIAPATSNVPTIRPTSVEFMPDMTMEQYNNLVERDPETVVPVFSTLYDEGCSWYCGGSVLHVTATSQHYPEAGFTYEASNAHDFDHESVWATEGSGVGESLTFTFAGNCPRITSVSILNGHVKTKQAWANNSRVKSLLLYYNGKPYKMLQLEDSRSLQHFELGTLGYGPQAEVSTEWTLTFEIREVYPGKKYKDCVIADFIFDGIDVH